MSFTLQIPRSHYDAMLSHALAEQPNECVGLLLGTPLGLVVAHVPLVNELASPTRFTSEPRSLLAAERQRRELGLEIVAIYHSHPTSPPIPSRTDLDPEVNYWLGLEVVSLIVSLQRQPPEVRGYWLEVGKYREAEWVVRD